MAVYCRSLRLAFTGSRTVARSQHGSRSISKVSLVVGSAGQDGHYLTELLRARGDHVIGISRQRLVSSQSGARPAIDILDHAQVHACLFDFRPQEIYYLCAHHGAAESGTPDSLLTYQRCHEAHVAGWLNFLDGVDTLRLDCRLFYAASSHVFGTPDSAPQNERTPLAPVCLYGITKVAGIGLCRHFRRARGVRCAAGILFNHESPRRPPPFVSRKIVAAAVDIKRGAKRVLTLGNLSAQVDWGAAEDYVAAMAAILQLDEPADFVIASGVLHTVRDFVAAAFARLDLPWEPYVVEDPALLRAVQRPVPLCGDATRLREATGWRPEIGFTDMVGRMVAAELNSRENSVK